MKKRFWLKTGMQKQRKRKEEATLKQLKRVLACALAVMVFGACSSQSAQPAAAGSSAPEAASTADAATTAETTAVESASEATEAVTEAPEVAEAAEVRVLALKGPTAMGMVHIMDDAYGGRIDTNNYQFTIAAAVDEVAPAVAKGEVDIAAVPANLAAVLYNNTDGAVKVLDVNTLGVLYIVDNGETVSSAADLAGKTLYASGKGATPEYALNYILSANDIDPETGLTIEWKSEHAECVAALLNDPEGVAMLPQPFVTTALMQNESLRVALDLTAEWEQIQGDEEAGSALVTGVTIVRTAFLEEHPEAVADFLERHKESAKKAADDVAGTAALIGAYDIVPEPVATKALPECNIVCISGDEMEGLLGGYLQVLYDANPQAVGGALPDEAFYVTD